MNTVKVFGVNSWLLFSSLMLLPLFFSARLLSEEEKKSSSHSIGVSKWLLLSPISAPAPAFHDGKKGAFEAADHLELTLVPRHRLWPMSGEEVTWPDGAVSSWHEIEPSAEGLVQLDPGEAAGESSSFSVAYAAAFVEAGGFGKVKVTVSSSHLAKAWLAGEELLTKKKSDQGEREEKGGKGSEAAGEEDSKDEKMGEASGDVELHSGRHLLLVKLVRGEGGPKDWSFAATIESTELGKDELFTDLSPRRGMTVDDLLDMTAVSNVSLSPDGELVAVNLSEHSISREGMDRWLEVRRFSDGSVVRSYRGASPSGVSWAPTSHQFSFVTREDKKSTLWHADLKTGEVRALLSDVERLGSHAWAPDGKSIIYSMGEEPEKIKAGVKRMLDLPDRLGGFRNRSYLYQLSVASLARRRLTAGELTTNLGSIHPAGTKLLFVRSITGTKVRPFSKTELYELDLKTLVPELLKVSSWLGRVQYSPDGSQILALGGPSSFGDVGVAVPAGSIANDYDTQAYLISRGGEVEAISKAFHPSVQNAVWSRADGHIYLTAQVGSRVGLFRYVVEAKEYIPLSTGVDVVGQISVAPHAARMVFTGSSSNVPMTVHSLDLKPGSRSQLILEPGEEQFEHVEIGKVKDWSFNTSAGTRIQGRVHFPRGFDESKKYPCIVYYYGGTSPVGRSFGGRYPKNLWSENGYVVYVLQPSGATGYGQEFSARHVNNWGITVADEIIQGTRKFLSAHSFVDPDRVGCIGASYGGFMTMLLVTRTDLFAAAISHAGISSISSYWGEGFWGYAYSAVASAESYPWNRPDVYVDQSPLFAADKITTPLLLLHGTGDTNVPPGESEQMYTALRVLGRDVEYVRFEGENHWILDYEKRVIWMRTILAWFDRNLKKDNRSWDGLYGDSKEE